MCCSVPSRWLVGHTLLDLILHPMHFPSRLGCASGYCPSLLFLDVAVSFNAYSHLSIFHSPLCHPPVSLLLERKGSEKELVFIHKTKSRLSQEEVEKRFKAPGKSVDQGKVSLVKSHSNWMGKKEIIGSTVWGRNEKERVYSVQEKVKASGLM